MPCSVTESTDQKTNASFGMSLFHCAILCLLELKVVLSFQLRYLTYFIHVLETPKRVLAKSADPDQMPHNVASDLDLHYFASCSAIFQQK